MIYVTIERTLPRRPEVVWAVLTDVAQLPAWIEGLVAAEIVPGSTRGPGMLVDVVRSVRGRRTTATCRVSAWQEPERLAIETRYERLLLLDQVVLVRTPTGTHLTLRGEVFFGNALDEFLTRPEGFLGGSRDDPALEGIYARSVDALVKHVVASTATPYR